jgi:hypothetical protein
MDSEFQISEYEVHQVGQKDFESKNVSFLAFKGKAVDMVQILRIQKRQRHVPDEKNYHSSHVIDP